MKCLVVEPSAAVRRGLVRTIGNLGWEKVLEAASLEEALAVEGGPAELVITGWTPPSLEAPELIRSFAGHPTWSSAQVVVVSSINRLDEVRRARDAGARDYVLRPFDPEALRHRVRYWRQAIELSSLERPAESEAPPAQAA